MKKLTLGLVLVLVLALALVAAPACGGDEEGAEFELSGLTITPSEAGVDEDVSIKVTVENVGEEEGSTEVALKVDGEEVDSKSVTVAAGASKTVTFTHSEAAEGTYAIKVDGQSGTLTVTAAPPGPPGAPGVGSTWEFLVDYDDGKGYTEVDHPYTLTLTEVNVTPTPGVCVPPAGVTIVYPLSNHYVMDSHPDGACPGATVPKRVAPTATLMFMGIDLWQNVTDKTVVWVTTPICITAPTPLGLLNVEVAYTDYTAVSGTVGYPYAVGDKWTYTRYEDAEVAGDCIAPKTKTFTVEVVEVDETVTVPAGTFTDCVEILETLDGTDNTKTTWWSPTVQSIVKDVDEGIGANGVQTQELSSYNLK